jgi:plastocyanin
VVLSRRDFLLAGGAAIAALSPAGRVLAGDTGQITMSGDSLGAEVWFDPVGLLVRPGTMVKWRNDDPGNSHTTTAYHPANRDHALRIPRGAIPWDSGYLLPGETFAVTLTEPGVYDYYCQPHEAAGMRGRIVVAAAGSLVPEEPSPDLPGLPAVAEILRLGVVRRDPEARPAVGGHHG